MGHVPFSAEQAPARGLPKSGKRFPSPWSPARRPPGWKRSNFYRNLPPPHLMQELITCAQALASPVIRAASLYLCAQL